MKAVLRVLEVVALARRTVQGMTRSTISTPCVIGMAVDDSSAGLTIWYGIWTVLKAMEFEADITAERPC